MTPSRVNTATNTPYYLSLKVNSTPWLGGTTKVRMLRAENTARKRQGIVGVTSKSGTRSGSNSMGNAHFEEVAANAGIAVQMEAAIAKETAIFTEVEVESLSAAGSMPRSVQSRMREKVSALNKEAVAVETSAQDTNECEHLFNIMATQCCGLHSVSGFQYHRHGLAPSVSSMNDRFQRTIKYTVPVTLKAFVATVERCYRGNRETNEMIRTENETAYAEWFAGPRKTPFAYPHPGFVPKPTSRPGMLLFTWNSPTYEKGAKSLAEQIKAAGLGVCTITPDTVNPNSGNKIAAMIWNIDIEAYDTYVEANKL